MTFKDNFTDNFSEDFMLSMDSIGNAIKVSLKNDKRFTKELQSKLKEAVGDLGYDDKHIQIQANKLTFDITYGLKYPITGITVRCGRNDIYEFSTSDKFCDIDMNDEQLIVERMERKKKDNEELQEKYGLPTQSDKDIGRHVFSDLNRLDYSIRPNVYLLKELATALGITRPDEFWVGLSQPLNQQIDYFSHEIQFAINHVQEVIERENILKKNMYYAHNTTAWKDKSGIVIESCDNAGFLIKKTENGVVVYGYDQGDFLGKPNHSLKELKNDVKDGVDLIKHVVLQIEDNKTVFVDNYLIGGFELHLGVVSDYLQEDFGTTIQKPNISSYEYKLSFFQKRYSEGELKFLEEAFLTGKFKTPFSQGQHYTPLVIGYFLDKEYALTGKYKKYNTPSWMTSDTPLELDEAWYKGFLKLVDSLKKLHQIEHKPVSKDEYYKELYPISEIIHLCETKVKLKDTPTKKPSFK